MRASCWTLLFVLVGWIAFKNDASGGGLFGAEKTSVLPAPADPGRGPATSVPASGSTLAPSALPPKNWIDQSQAEADRKSAGCLSCHDGIEPMHPSPSVVLGCTDCHGGHAGFFAPKGSKKGDPGYEQAKNSAHVQPLNKEFWPTSANPVNSDILLNHESAEFIQFFNPGDLRVAQKACGLCHEQIINNSIHSMMATGAMLWGAATYNNGALNRKNYILGQGYGPGGTPLELLSPIPITPEETQKYGWLPALLPLPRFSLGQPGNVFRIFEKGNNEPLDVGNPFPDEPPGRPLSRLSDRGLGTELRIDPVVVNAQKTRLNDPLLDFLGSNDRGGDYRSSGCSACHVVYANDRSPTNSGWYSRYGHQGLSFSGDPTIPKNERGHPIQHQFTRAIPSSQCITCHQHQGNLFVNTYLGYTWWDEETDAQFFYPKQQVDPTDESLLASQKKTPEAAAAKGLWGDVNFLDRSAELNPKLQDMQIADYHSKGWIYRAIFKKDRHGDLLDENGNVIAPDDPMKWAKAVHLNDVHLAKGMQCIDCHFEVEEHGNGLLYGEPRNMTTITCVDCHGTIEKRPTLVTGGKGGDLVLTPGQPPTVQPVDIGQSYTTWGPRFYWVGNELYQRSSMSPDITWQIPQTVDTIDPSSPHYNAASRYAKTMMRDGVTWGSVPDDPEKLAHSNKDMDCQVCHTSWATSCFGCHLPLRTNNRIPTNKFEGVTSRILTSYNPQVVRDDVFMLGIDGTVKDHRMAVIRSSSAVVVSSQNANREWVYGQQETISAEGYSGQAFNPHFPHTTSGVGTTKNCTDCHISKTEDNNAIMAQLLGFGTGTVNFFGRFAWVAAGNDGFYAVPWTEWDEPQAVIGSSLHSIAYPRNYAEHLAHNRNLQNAEHHDGSDILDIWRRGEYIYTAAGPNGFIVYDSANIYNKGFSEKVVTAPVSPLGQRTYVRTPYCTAVALPSTLSNDGMRTHLPENEEQPIHPLYNYAYLTDRVEGLVLVDVTTLFNGNPEDNFFKKDVVFNPGNQLSDGTALTVAGRYVYITTNHGLYVVDVNMPTKPVLVGEYTGTLRHPRSIAVQFRYAFVTDDDGLKVLDITDPTKPAEVPGALVRLKHAQRLYLARTYAFVADGADGLAIVNIERARQPVLDQLYNAGGQLNDTRAVQVGSVAASMYALVADGKNGLRVLQLISPDTVPEAAGFAPRPKPQLIATYHTAGPALAVARGLDRDRVADESGHQTVVFGRRGSRPFNLSEMNAFYRSSTDRAWNDPDREQDGDIYRVDDVFWRDGQLKNSEGKVLTPNDGMSADSSNAPPKTAGDF
ncbi:MAG TPA: hypothetical protein VL981_14170 [Candidatus Methylacidiphilales bacterium]|nr:hypothetical protein [Candidatus Methylacidiphilales bacterium]